jgi:hypothetical protein
LGDGADARRAGPGQTPDEMPAGEPTMPALRVLLTEHHAVPPHDDNPEELLKIHDTAPDP